MKAKMDFEAESMKAEGKKEKQEEGKEKAKPMKVREEKVYLMVTINREEMKKTPAPMEV